MAGERTIRGPGLARRGLNLSQPTMTIGNAAPPQADLASLLQQAQTQGPPQDDFRRDARNYALQDVLSNQPTVESGSVAEALAEALAGGIRGRALRGERERELGADARARSLEQALADREYKTDIQQHADEVDFRNRGLAADTDYRTQSLGLQRAQLEEETRSNRATEQIARTRANSENRPNPPPQVYTQLSSLSDAATTARDIQGAVRRFRALNQQQGTGGLGVELQGLWGEGRNRLTEMASLTDYLVPRLNAAVRLPGAASERDAQRLEGSAPNIRNPGAVNANVINAYEQTTQNAIDYSIFAQQYVQRNPDANLLGVEEAWNVYLEANPIHDAAGNVRSNRPTFQQWVELGAPDYSQQGDATNNTTNNSMAGNDPLGIRRGAANR